MSYAPRVYGTGYERFVPKVEIDRETGCWNWTASTTPGGYGSLSLPNGERCVAHRFSYEHHVGPIPDGLQIDHLCRNRRCVNPEHLEPVTQRENILRGESTAAQRARQTHCKRGHEFTPDNLVQTVRYRSCKTCHRQRMYARRHGLVWV